MSVPGSNRRLPSLEQNENEPQVKTVNTRKKTRRPAAGVDGAATDGVKKRQRIRTRNPDERDLPQSPAADISGEETPLSENSGPPSGRRPRTKRKRRQPPESGGGGELVNGNPIFSLLNDEDVVNVDKIDEAVVMTNLPGVAAGSGGSAVTDKIYVQTTNGFATHNQDWVNERNKTLENDARFSYGEERAKPSHIAEQNERIFMFISLVIHGALAGFSIWQVVVSYSLYYPGELNFLTQYQGLAMPTQTVYYIILVFCTISAMDRYDFAAKDKHLLQSLAKFDLAAVSVLIYYIALLFSVGMVGLEAWIGSGVALPSTTTPSPLSSTVSTTTLPPELSGMNLDTTSTVNTWLALNVIRAVLASLGWLIIAFDPLRNDMTWE